MRRRYASTVALGAMLLTLQAASAQQLPGTLTQQPGTIVEMVIIPCLPGMPKNKCGVTLKLVQGSATFTSDSGQTISLSSANQTVSVNGDGAVTQSSQLGSILNFAATGATTTAAIGGGGGGGGAVGSLGPNGGSNGGNSNTASNGTTSGGGSLTGGGGGGGGGTGVSTSVSP